MPEMPDVEVFKRYMDSTSLHKTVEDLRLRDTDILEKTSADELEAGLKGHQLTSTDRHGKYLFAQTDGDLILVLHFGMTGDLKYFKAIGKEPEYTYLRLDFANGYHLSYVMVRKLGLMRLIDDQHEFIAEKELGPDVWKPGFDYEVFARCLEGRRGMVKPTLMNQKIMAGLGNVYVDEILFQAEIHPETAVNDLNPHQLQEIYSVGRRALRIAVERQADPSRFPDAWITPRRGDDQADCPKCGGEIKNTTVSGRTTYFCPRCQSV
jgi:formamidopyrimidine-DNA glycosylase